MDHTITLGSIIGIVTIISVGWGLLLNARKMRRENEADARARTDELKKEFRLHDNSTDDRLTKVETRIADFMPRGEIEAKIEHEKLNRQQADHAQSERVSRHERDIVEIKVSLGKVEQKQGDLVTDMTEIKALVKEQGRDLGAKIDKLVDALRQS